MSFYDDASLIMYPSGYKANKIYSLKPTDGSGDLDFTRSNDTATRVNSAGLIEKVRTNVLTYSQDLSNADWQVISNGGPVTKTANAGTAPDGTNTASRVQITGGGGYTVVAQGGVNPLGIVTLSGYFKRYGATDQVFRLFANNGSATANLTATDTWQRFTFTVNASSTGADGFANDTSNNPCDILVWGMQLETGDIATDYIPTTTAAVSVGMIADIPRIDYTGGGCGSLLLEPQRTNLVTYSEQFDNAYWTPTGLQSISTNAIISPDGELTADELIEDSLTSFHRVISSEISLTAGLNYSFSVFVKNNGVNIINLSAENSNDLELNASFDLVNETATATSGTAKIENYGNGWYRCIVSGISNVTRTQSMVINLNRLNVSFPFSYLGDGVSGAFIWGAQLEEGSYSTSYIPTLSAASTRGADSCFKTGISSLIGQTEGVVFIDFVASAQNADGVAFSGITIFGSAADNFQIYTIGTTLYWYARNSAGVLIDQTANQTLVAGQRYKIAYAYKSSDWALYVNGVQKRTNTAAAVPAVSQFNLSATAYGAAVATVKNDFSQAILFPTRLSNAELETLTTL